MNNRILNSIIDFGFIVNTELGLIRFIRENFQDERAFNLDNLNKSDREILSLLYSRRNYNPLSIISTEENLNDIDELYDSFFSNYKAEIIKKSTIEKSIDKFVVMATSLTSLSGTVSSIYVRDDIEQSVIKKYFDRAATTRNKDTLKMNDIFYLRSVDFLKENNLLDISGKSIYLSPYLYNITYFNQNKLSKINKIVLMGKDYSEDDNQE